MSSSTGSNNDFTTTEKTAYRNIVEVAKRALGIGRNIIGVPAAGQIIDRGLLIFGEPYRIDASALPLFNPYFIFKMPSEALFGGSRVSAWQRA